MPKTRKMPTRTAKIVLDGDYDGWEATVRINIPIGTYNRIFFSNDWDEKREALNEVIREWNFVDDNGDAISLPLTPEDFGKLPLDLLIALSRKIDEAVTAPLARQ